ncbi:hypothetical protein FGG08_005219 [Glutinoglossum americanum]|uniref:Uncharacterized protein n=1 Tax=Glutinoglossum americanum TaxID=1670608 RepID=A0A9P8HYM1_9PEZI|nr:hypothetical protein FGG08_005219 [Glutinoglossum americanum]
MAADPSSTIASSIPLFCIICPNNPSFSDVSHLLTHVSSKAHLAHQFKLQVRTAKEGAAQDQLNSYQSWYDYHGIGALLSERMSAKEEKVARAKAKTNHVNTRPGPKKRTVDAPKDLPFEPPNDAEGQFHDAFSHELSQHDSKSDSSLLDSQPYEVNGINGAAAGPYLRLWPTALDRLHETPKFLQNPFSTELDQELLRCNYDYNISDMRDQLDPFLDHHTEQSVAPDTPSIETVDSPDFMAQDFEQTTEGLRVKGVYWPGMGLFDSATPEQKRTRNQKKDGTVLAQMEINSTEVEPNELIFRPDFNLKKEHRITGPDDDRSCNDELSPPRKRAPRAKRSMLTDKSTNIAVVRKPKARRVSKDKSSKTGDPGTLSKTGPALPNGRVAEAPQKEGRRFSPTEDETEEFKLTVGNLGQKKKRGFDIFRDSEERENISGTLRETVDPGLPYRPSYGYTGFESPLEFSFLNQGHSVQPDRLSPITDPLQRPITSFFRPISSRSSGDKENVEPILNRFGEIDVETAENAPGMRSTQRYFAMAGAHPPQFFHILPPQMDFGAFGGPDPSGFSSNPLIFEFQHQQIPQANFGGQPEQGQTPPGRTTGYGRRLRSHFPKSSIPSDGVARDGLFGDINE